MTPRSTWKLSGLVAYGHVLTMIAKEPIHVNGAYRIR